MFPFPLVGFFREKLHETCSGWGENRLFRHGSRTCDNGFLRNYGFSVYSWIVVLLSLLLCLGQQGLPPSSPPNPTDARQQWMEVRKDGVFRVGNPPKLGATVGPGGLHAPTPGRKVTATVQIPRWQVDDLGQNWNGQAVAIGDSGAWMLGGKGSAAEGVVAYPTGDPIPFFDFALPNSLAMRPAVAARAGRMATMSTHNTGFFSFESTVYGWSLTNGATPAWTLTLPNTGNVMAGFLGISADGTRTVAAVSNTNGTTHIRVIDEAGMVIQSFDPASSSNIRYGTIDATASRLYLGMFNGIAEIYDLHTGALLHSLILGGSFDSHALSGDGKTFAYGNFLGITVLREITPGTWTTVAFRPGALFHFPGPLDLNADGSRCGFMEQRFFPGFDDFDVGMWDVENNTEMWSDGHSAPGTTLQLIAAGLEMDELGETLAGISWGDSFNLTPEVFVYSDQGRMTSSLDLAGSAISLAMDPDGDAVVIGAMAQHENQGGNGGSILCLDADDQDLHITGFPQLGGTLTIYTPDTAQTAIFAISKALGASPSPYGITEIDLGERLTTTLLHTVPAGGLFLPLMVPSKPGLADIALHFQGVRFDPVASLTNKVSVHLVP